MNNDKNNDKMNLFTDYNIKSYKVRVIDSETNETVIMDRDEAIELAKSKGMNLVQISFNKNVFPGSICKIIDYSKYKYEQKKRAKDIAKKNKQSVAEVKEIDFTIRIDTNDKNIKISHIREFLEAGNKVCIAVVLARRELDRKRFAEDLMKEILNNFNDIAELDGKPSFEGRKLSCVLKKSKR